MPTFTHGKATKVLVDGATLSDFFKEYNYASKMDTAETSTFGTSTKTYVQGMNDSTLSLSGYFDGAAGAVDAVLSAEIGAADNIIVTVSPTGSFALGARVISGQAIESDYSVTGGIGTVVEVSAAFQGNGTIRPATSIHDFTVEAAGATGASTDTNRISAQGGILVVHASAGTGTVKVQTSADNVTFVDYATVTLAGAGGYSVVVQPGLTANKFIRQINSAAATFQANFVRF